MNGRARVDIPEHNQILILTEKICRGFTPDYLAEGTILFHIVTHRSSIMVGAYCNTPLLHLSFYNFEEDMSTLARM